jgi:asparagine synthase (glutamine-hydrolysing)
MQYGFEITLGPAETAEIRLFHPKARDRQTASFIDVATDPTTGAVLVLMGQLYYRDDLRSQLPEAQHLPCASDAALALAMFRASGVPGLQRLEGDFSLAIVDAQASRLLAMRDPMGAWPLFWTADRGTVRLGTSLRALVARQGTTRVNLDFVASFVMFPLPTPELPTDETALTPGKRILPGTIVALDCHGRSEVLWQHDWLQYINAASPVHLEEAATQVKTLFREAVWQRLARGKIAVHLSGGMDSLSVVGVARRFFAEGRLSGPPSTLSVVYSTPELAGERTYVQMVVDQGGPLKPYYIDGDAEVDFNWFDGTFPHHDEPYLGLYRFAFEKRVIETACRTGATVMLTGMGGDVLFEGNRFYAADLLRQGRLYAALLETRRWAQAGNASLWSVFSRQRLEPNLPGILRGGMGTLLRRGYGRWPQLAPTSVPPWVRPGFARTYRLWRKGTTIARRHNRFPVERSYNRYALQMSAGDWASWYIGGPWGRQTSHPFHDPRLVQYVMGLPRVLREVPGRPKAVLQEAMRDVLPEPIRTRRLKRHFNEPYGRGLGRNLPHLERLVRTSRISDLGIFDTRQLLHTLRQAAMGIGDFKAFGRLNTSLAFIAWVNQLAAPWSQREPSATHRLALPSCPRSQAITTRSTSGWAWQNDTATQRR